MSGEGVDDFGGGRRGAGRLEVDGDGVLVGSPKGAGALDEEGADLREDGAGLGGGEREEERGQRLAEVWGP